MMRTKYIPILVFTTLLLLVSVITFRKENNNTESKTSLNSRPFSSINQVKTVSLIAVGDVMLSRDVERKIKQTGESVYPLLKVKDYLGTGDIVFGNLESPITPGREVAVNEMVFRAPVGAALGLKTAGFTVLSLANNHIPNFSERGVTDTIKYIDEAGLLYAGAGKNEEEAYAPVFLEKNGIKFAFLAYNDSDVVPASYRAGLNHAGTAIMDGSKLAKGVSRAKETSDFVIVSMHSGTEYAKYPNKRQVNFARAAVDEGADLVIGHHPHVIQGIENYKGKYILYSLGNFVFDQLFSRETREGLIARVTFSKKSVEQIELKPTLINFSLHPEILNGEEAEKILKSHNLQSTYD